jgi:hypothetical protein
VCGVAFALSVAPASTGTPDDTPDADVDLVILVGTYSCFATYYAVLDEPPITLISHRISFSGTGLLVQPRHVGGPPKVRGAIHRPPNDRPEIPAGLTNNLSLSASVDLGEGTAEECIPIAELIASAVAGRGCVASPVRSNPVPYYLTSAGFTLICEGPAAEQVRTIGDLSRAIVTAQLP